MQALDRILDELLALDPALVEHLGDALVGLGLDEAEGEVLQLPLELPHSQPVGQRRVDVQALARHLDAGLARQVGVEAQGLGARGQTHQHDADVLDHRQQHLAQHLGLRADLGALELVGEAGEHAQAVELVQAAHQPGDRRAEARPDLLGRIVELFPGREQQRGDPGFGVEAQGGGDQRGAERVRPGRLAGAEDLALVEVGDPVERRLDARALCRSRPAASMSIGGAVSPWEMAWVTETMARIIPHRAAPRTPPVRAGGRRRLEASAIAACAIIAALALRRA